MPNDFHLYRKARPLHWREITARLREQPESLAVPLANIERWLAKGRLHPAPLIEWRRRILLAKSSPAEFASLLDYLEADNEDSEPLKSCSPFVGMSAA
jgi:hypothetical protein